MWVSKWTLIFWTCLMKDRKKAKRILSNCKIFLSFFIFIY